MEDKSDLPYEFMDADEGYDLSTNSSTRGSAVPNDTDDLGFFTDSGNLDESGFICIPDRNGAGVIDVPLAANDTVDKIIDRAVKSLKYEDKDGSHYELTHGKHKVPRGITWRETKIPYDSVLSIDEKPMQIFIRDVNGAILTLNARRSDTVRSLKEQFYEHRQVPIHQQRLQFQSKPLEDDKTLQFYGIRNNSTIESTYRLRGGAN